MKDKASYNFKDVKSGTTFPGVQFQLIVNKLPRNLTGASIIMNINNTFFTTDNGSFVITDPVLGKFQFKKQLINLPKGSWPYELLIKFPDGDVKTYLMGFWRVF